MRDMMDDAHAHKDDGLGRAQKANAPQLMKRFYETVSVVGSDRGYALHLDGRNVKTPSGKVVIVPNAGLAELLKDDWEAQQEHIDPRTMHHTRLFNAAVEGGEKAQEPLRESILNYVQNDLLFYRVETPQSLVERQEKHWDAVLNDMARHFGVSFETTLGIQHVAQSDAVVSKLRESLVDVEHFLLTAMMSITNLTGSGLLAIGLRTGLVEPDFAWDAAHVDEDYNIAQWGEDAEAMARRAVRRQEFDAAIAVMAAL